MSIFLCLMFGLLCAIVGYIIAFLSTRPKRHERMVNAYLKKPLVPTFTYTDEDLSQAGWIDYTQAATFDPKMEALREAEGRL